MRRLLLALLVAGCATLPAPQDLEARVAAQLERRGLGAEALLVPANLLAHRLPPPRAAHPAVLRLLEQPLAAADAARIFGDAVPPALGEPGEAAPAAFEDLLKIYLDEMAAAVQLLRAATRDFAEPDFSGGLPPPDALLALAEAVEHEALERANRAFVDATVRFAKGMRMVTNVPTARTFSSPVGTVTLGSRGNDIHERAPVRGAAFSVVVDPGGDDEYRGSDLAVRGFSAIIDLSGNDRYEMSAGLGAALAGAALVLDFAGNDSYQAKYFGLGAAAFGFGALVDLGGDDRYTLDAWGQGFGLAGGTGLLWDRGGNDRYAARGVPDPFGRGSGLSGAQGAAFGARGRIAGGLGILRDDGGDDRYEAQMFAQGTGYYYGLGLLWDRGGDDSYEAYRYAQGHGAHQAVGVLRDESGHDRYGVTDAYGQGMGLDMAVGILFDGGGDDSYRAHAAAQGTATANGIGVLADEAGADRYALSPDDRGWGSAWWLRGLPSVGVLLRSGSAQFARAGKPMSAPPENPPLIVQPNTADRCPAEDPGEALLCRVLDAPDLEQTWAELKAILEKDAATPLAGWIALALARRPPANAEEIAALLAQRESCNVRALALRARPTLAAAQTGIRSSCFRLQSAARAAFVRLGEPLPGDAALPLFLHALPPQDDTL